jgi:hypothetical protein
MGEWRASGSFASLRMTARTDSGKDSGKGNGNGKGNSKGKYKGLSTAVAKCAASGRDDVVFVDDVC